MVQNMQIMDENNVIRFHTKNDPYFEFSNFYECPMIIDGNTYKTVEHYFQCQKYNKDLGKNLEFMILIKGQNTPGQAKMLANPIKKTVVYEWEKKLKSTREKYEKDLHFSPKEWDAQRDDVMKLALIAKFTQNEHCKKLLLSTEDKIISEYSKWDHYWGNGGDNKKIGRLGQLIMSVRDLLKKN